MNQSPFNPSEESLTQDGHAYQTGYQRRAQARVFRVGLKQKVRT
jgi:hypothetical protein